MSAAHNAPAAIRNRDAILQVLRQELGEAQTVLEIGSGTGQHAVHFAAALPELSWQTSDLAENHEAIHYWIEHAGLANVLSPLLLDVSDPGALNTRYSAVFSANTAHIMSQSDVEDMIAYVGRSVQERGKFLLYGPFRVNGEFMGDGNKQFDQSLKSQKSSMGIRDLEWIDELAVKQGKVCRNTYAMPANNLLVIWQMAGKGDKNGDA